MNINEFKLGCNFDFDLLYKIIELNKLSNTNKITELYGSDRAHSFLAARPNFRLPDISKDDFEKYIKIAKENGINFNYTMNSIIPYGSKTELCKNIKEIISFVKYLESIGVYRITISNPMLLEIIRNKAHSNIEIELSTIAHIDTVTQIKYYHEKYNVNKFCCNLNKNRNFKFLKIAADYCKKNNIILELMVNEFCGVCGDNYSTHCIYRDSCYICHATNKSLADTLLLDEYPMKLCTSSRNKNIENWLKLKFIRPEDINIYNKININNFKITGRTGSSDYILKVAKAYLLNNFNGNLLELWKPLESIKDNSIENIHQFIIENKKLDGFLEMFLKNENHNCDNEICGETCNYCSNFYKKNILGGNINEN